MKLPENSIQDIEMDDMRMKISRQFVKKVLKNEVEWARFFVGVALVMEICGIRDIE